MECVDSFIRFAITLPILSVVMGAVVVASLMLPDPGLLTRPPALQITLAASLLLAAAIANLVAPRMRIRTWGKRRWVQGDKISG